MSEGVRELEELRKKYKPEKIHILFISESIPTNGTFFYNMDSALYRLTKEAFEEVIDGLDFTLDWFCENNCYLYDIARMPVNELNFKKKSEEVKAGIPLLAEFLRSERPEYIISVDNDNMMPIAMANTIAEGPVDSSKIYDMPDPFIGNHRIYKEKLIGALKEIFAE